MCLIRISETFILNKLKLVLSVKAKGKMWILFCRLFTWMFFAKNSKLWHMINKITYVAFIVLLLNQGGGSASKGKSNIFQGSPCGSCYWNGKPKEASYQKKPISPVRDWKTGVIYRPPIKHQRVWNEAPPPFGGRWSIIK